MYHLSLRHFLYVTSCYRLFLVTVKIILLYMISVLCFNLGGIYVIWQLKTKFCYLLSISLPLFRVITAWQNIVIPYSKQPYFLFLVFQFCFNLLLFVLWLFIIYLIILNADNSFPSHSSSYTLVVLTPQRHPHSYVPG